MSTSLYQLTNPQRVILEVLAKRGPKTKYDLSAKPKTKKNPSLAGDSKTVRAGVTILEKHGFIKIHKISEFKPTKEQKTYYALTFKGFLFALHYNIVELKNIREIKEKHEIDIPEPPMLKPLMLDMEKNFPEIFYSFLVKFDPLKIIAEWLNVIGSLAAFFSFIYLYKTKSQYVKKYIKGKDLVLSDGTIVEDYKTAFKTFKTFLDPLIQLFKKELDDLKQ